MRPTHTHSTRVYKHGLNLKGDFINLLILIVLSKTNNQKPDIKRSEIKSQKHRKADIYFFLFSINKVYNSTGYIGFNFFKR